MLQRFIQFLGSFEYYGNISDITIENWLLDNVVITSNDNYNIEINHNLTYSSLEIMAYDDLFQETKELVMVFDNNKHFVFKNTMLN